MVPAAGRPCSEPAKHGAVLPGTGVPRRVVRVPASRRANECREANVKQASTAAPKAAVGVVRLGGGRRGDRFA